MQFQNYKPYNTIRLSNLHVLKVSPSFTIPHGLKKTRMHQGYFLQPCIANSALLCRTRAVLPSNYSSAICPRGERQPSLSVLKEGAKKQRGKKKKPWPPTSPVTASAFLTYRNSWVSLYYPSFLDSEQKGKRRCLSLCKLYFSFLKNKLQYPKIDFLVTVSDVEIQKQSEIGHSIPTSHGFRYSRNRRNRDAPIA